MTPRALLALRATAIATFSIFVISVIVAGAGNGSLAFDFNAYYLAAQRLLAGEQVYDPNATATGGFGLYFYPPPFLLLIGPLTALPMGIAGYVWIGAVVAATIVAIALLPVAPTVRWVILLLAGVSSPLLTAIVVGQVGPMLLLLFVIAWRSLERPIRFGIAAGLGTIIKLQPVLLIAWAVATRRRVAAAAAVGTIALLAAITLPLAGPQAWLDEAALLGRVSRPILTPHAYGVGRLLYEAGLPESSALVAHWINLALVACVLVVAIWRGSPVASFLVAATASQFVSPVLWDHYALVLLLPTAWLLHRGHWWAALIPLLTSSLLLPLNVPWFYAASFWVALLAVTWEGSRSRSGERVDLALAVPAT